ncbi:hypothetical protein D9V37_06860 [Nocardioides mangrovicus]|uniref:Mycothiol-dependent maleylpyruvate isomerase metal-binding domain-containing protein n=1 Tax=Nocardioides mangrovicus TaxID=2478913 RepID=A0A3L8P3G1_9ACTN|nr:maleylpyruvate isomerase N-terminal domain-containing protein [Nocardioides mangrovicus]RLV49634.1 hypothetical protein D9V37_06860 [Nocardioides mangrovicus]
MRPRGFGEVVGGPEDARLDSPGLGDWDVRALLGHTCRAFLTVESYLAPAEPGGGPTLTGAADYFRAVAAGLADPAQVRQRGVDAGAALGEDPRGAALAIATRVAELVVSTPDEAPVATPVGLMILEGYLPTRAFELTVHTLDLARALDRPVPDVIAATAAPALELCARLLPVERQVAVLLALTGRESLPVGFSVLGG